MQLPDSARESSDTGEPLTLVVECSRAVDSGGTQLFFKLTEYLSGPKRVELLWKRQWSFTTNLLSRIWRSRVLRYLRTRSRIGSTIYCFLAYRMLLPRFEVELGRRYSGVAIQGVWAPSNELMPMLAMALAKKFACPFHISMFDIPYTFSLKKRELAIVEHGFRGWIKEAASVDYATPEMQSYCKQLRNGKVEDDIAIWSSAGVSCGRARTRQTRSRVRRIALCGSLRFFREIRCLSEALTLLERRYGEKVVLWLFSGKPLDLPAVEYKGFVADRAKLIEALDECDLAYSPLSLNPKDRLLVETSFPGKIATYLQADLPILAHAPESASNYRFVTGNGVGIGIDTLNPEWIAEKVHEYSESVELRECHARNCRAVLERFFATEQRADYFSRLFTQSSCNAEVL